MRERIEGLTPPQESQPEAEKEADKKNKSGGKIGGWARKSAALAGAVGVGLFGGIDHGQAKGAEDLLKFGGETGAKKLSVDKPGERMVLDDPVYSIKATGHKEKIKTGYGLELQELYTVTDKKTGESRQFFSADEKGAIENGKEFLFPIDPESFPDFKKIVETERAFQQSGLTESGGYSGPIEIVGKGKQKSLKDSTVERSASSLTKEEITKGNRTESTDDAKK